MWIQSKIRYEMLLEGEPKRVTESYLHDAVSFGDAEGQCFEHLKTRITELQMVALNDTHVAHSDVLFFPFQEGDFFWKVKTRHKTETYTGKAKTVYDTFIVPALDDRQASDRVLTHLKGSLVSYSVIAVTLTTILAVYMPHNEIWKGDWLNRMDDLAAQGKKSSTHNQTELDFAEATPESPMSESEIEDAIRQPLRDMDKRAKANGYTISTKKPEDEEWTKVAG